MLCGGKTCTVRNCEDTLRKVAVVSLLQPKITFVAPEDTSVMVTQAFYELRPMHSAIR